MKHTEEPAEVKASLVKPSKFWFGPLSHNRQSWGWEKSGKNPGRRRREEYRPVSHPRARRERGAKGRRLSHTLPLGSSVKPQTWPLVVTEGPTVLFAAAMPIARLSRRACINSSSSLNREQPAVWKVVGSHRAGERALRRLRGDEESMGSLTETLLPSAKALWKGKILNT